MKALLIAVAFVAVASLVCTSDSAPSEQATASPTPRSEAAQVSLTATAPTPTACPTLAACPTSTACPADTACPACPEVGACPQCPSCPAAAECPQDTPCPKCPQCPSPSTPSRAECEQLYPEFTWHAMMSSFEPDCLYSPSVDMWGAYLDSPSGERYFVPVCPGSGVSQAECQKLYPCPSAQQCPACNSCCPNCPIPSPSECHLLYPCPYCPEECRYCWP